MLDAPAENEVRRQQKIQQVIRLMLMLTKVSQEKKKVTVPAKEDVLCTGLDRVLSASSASSASSLDVFSKDLDPRLKMEIDEVARIFDRYDKNGDGKVFYWIFL